MFTTTKCENAISFINGDRNYEETFFKRIYIEVSDYDFIVVSLQDGIINGL